MGTANRNISLRAMRVFCTAAERESFRQAAESLFLTSSAVSHQIKHLETELGTRLFDRASRSLQLTPEGCALYEEVSPLISDFDQVIARHAKARRPRSLRISVQPFFGSELFVPRLPEFVEQHPDIDISIDTSDETSERHPANADVSIRIFKSPPANLAYVRLFPLRLIPAGTLGLYDATTVRAGKISGRFPLLIHASRPNAWREWQRSSRIRLPDLSDGIRLDSMIAIARAAEQGLGAALVPQQLSQAWFKSTSLVQLFEHELLTEDAYYLVYRQEDRDNNEVQAFRAWVLQKFVDE
ncbi:MAG: LysR family transcriptional regulator [Woeseiaceae bacterium]|nr:LysR family transcriptional regulator [Woeseiaceae bacterium]